MPPDGIMTREAPVTVVDISKLMLIPGKWYRVVTLTPRRAQNPPPGTWCDLAIGQFITDCYYGSQHQRDVVTLYYDGKAYPILLEDIESITLLPPGGVGD